VDKIKYLIIMAKSVLAKKGKLSKQILNYFATFTETRFNFKRLISYRWTDNELTLDVSLFPKFQHELLTRVKTGDLSQISVVPGQYSLKLSGDLVKEELLKRLSANYNTNYLEVCISDNLPDSNTIIIVDEKGEANTKEESVDISDVVWKEGIRKFNIALRRELENIVIKQQERFIDSKKEEFGISTIPRSTFGLNNYLQEHFNQWQILGNDTQDPEAYIQLLRDSIKEETKDIVLYDLFYNLQKYNEFANLGTAYIFFHSISKDTNSFPLYFLEIEIRPSRSEVLLTFPRDLLLINSPAINGYKFEQVLTTPRSCTVDQADAHLGTVEVFLQSQYGISAPFIVEPAFREIIHDEEERPSVQSRIGIQTITNEDKKLLDYSEIMTRLDVGGGSRFTDLVSTYIDGNIPNFQENVSREYKEKYPAKKPQRYITNSPIPINDSQKRILLALANEKNRLMVIDGPPGTGKSHTIAALTYWANEENKSVVITSHKKEALDVIDRMLTDKFKALHPQSKPSIVRMDKETGSENGLQNTLQSAVVNAANDRSLEFNNEAISSDTETVREELEQLLSERIDSSANAADTNTLLVEYFSLTKSLSSNESIQKALGNIPKRTGLTAAISDIQKSIVANHFSSLQGTSIEEYKWIHGKYEQLGEFLKACETVNNVPEEVLEIKTSLKSIPEDYKKLLAELATVFKTNVPLGELTTDHGASGFLANILGRGVSKEKKDKLIQQLKSLQHNSIVDAIARSAGKTRETATLNDLAQATGKIEFKIGFARYEAWIDEYKTLPENSEKSIPEIFTTIRQHRENPGIFEDEIVAAVVEVFDVYGDVLTTVDITPDNLGSIATKNSDTATQIWRLIELHAHLSDLSVMPPLRGELNEQYFELTQKRIEHTNDERFKKLNNHLNELQRIKVSYEGGKRFSREEVDVLLKNISCLIAEPSTISKYFPMEEDMIDVLIIDEASQVSIAESISLILRAKQVVVFGDEYQYGAVSAVNVNAKYSTSYFSEIINAYQDEFHTQVSEEAKQQLVNEVSKEYSEEEQESDQLVRPDEIAPGTILWLKTFNIRTSTLSFAKAMANYTTSLKEHFRSFPEIISYSNEFFYKPAQLELIVNRIRTQPIDQTLQFMSVKTKGEMAPNTNLDEIDAIINDITKRIDSGYTGTIGIIASFREQQARLDQAIQERLDMPRLKQNHKLAIWFVGDVQGEERDIIYYSFVEDKNINNADLASIYPVIGGTADNVRSLKMQRLNVGFSRAKNTMVFVHSQDIEKYANTRLGDALKHYHRVLEESKKNDMFVVDESVFDSPKEKELYQLLMQTKFVQDNKDAVHIIPQFPIGKYLRAEFAAKIPDYRTDFLVTLNRGGKTQTLILEYDGLEYHFKNPNEVSSHNLSNEFIDYDIQRQLELESYGYRFLRINYFTLLPEHKGETKTDVLNQLLIKNFS